MRVDFGKMVFAPDANQGPLLGTFVTGPLGAVIGAAWGAIRWNTRYGGSGNRRDHI